MNELTHLSLFSGIGGLDLAAEWAGFETVGQCEFAEYPTKVLEKHWPNVPRWRDVRDVTRFSLESKIPALRGGRRATVVSGGFPCQPHSLAGKRLGADDERDLWSELFRIFMLAGKWLVAENVPGLLSTDNGRFFGRVLRDLAQSGCVAWWYCFPAYSAGAKFIGERVCLVAASDSVRRIRMDNGNKIDEKYSKMLDEWETRQNDILPYPKRDYSETCGRIKRNDDGLPDGLDALKAYGNAVVPYQFYPIFKSIAEIESMEDKQC